MKTTYTILLVDDEEAVRTSIKNLTPWAEYGFEVMAEASNGQEALSAERISEESALPLPRFHSSNSVPEVVQCTYSP